jgi:hypothetical protein
VLTFGSVVSLVSSSIVDSFSSRVGAEDGSFGCIVVLVVKLLEGRSERSIQVSDAVETVRCDGFFMKKSTKGSNKAATRTSRSTTPVVGDECDCTSLLNSGNLVDITRTQ